MSLLRRSMNNLNNMNKIWRKMKTWNMSNMKNMNYIMISNLNNHKDIPVSVSRSNSPKAIKYCRRNKLNSHPFHFSFFNSKFLLCSHKNKNSKYNARTEIIMKITNLRQLNSIFFWIHQVVFYGSLKNPTDFFPKAIKAINLIEFVN